MWNINNYNANQAANAENCTSRDNFETNEHKYLYDYAQICVCFKMSVVNIYKWHMNLLFHERIRQHFYKYVCI